MRFCLIFVFAVFILTFDSCTYPERIRDGETAYERMQYSVAVKMLGKEFNRGKSSFDKAKKAYLLGRSYSRMNENSKALEWYKKAYDLQYGPEALRDYAFALKRTGKYSEAASVFDQVGRELGDPFKYQQEVESCTLAAEWDAQKDSSEYSVSDLQFNSVKSDYAPALFSEDRILISSDRAESEGEKPYKWYGNDFSDIYLVDLNSNVVESFDNELNTDFNEGSITFNSDRSRVYFTRCGSDRKGRTDYCKILYAIKKRDGGWSNARTLTFVSGEVNFRHPFLAADDNTIYFSSDDPRGFGGYDLYKSIRGDDGWSEPYNLGSKVNTEGNEVFPFVTEDTLYFASDGHKGMGGLDIFRATLIDDRFRQVQNLKAPINSAEDDFSLVVSEQEINADGTTQQGYFASSRLGGKGSDDIYRFSRIIPPPPPVMVEDTTPVEPIVYKIILDGIVLRSLYANPNDPNSKTSATEPLNAADVSITYKGESIRIQSDEAGRFSLELEEETDYSLIASKPEFLNNSGFVTTKGIEKNEDEPITRLTVTLVLDQLFRNVDINLPNIYYDFDKWDIRADAQPTLNDLAVILSNNPQINRIQLSSHTDCRGGFNYNEDLSQKRAQSAVDYLISLGVSPERLTAKGYGENEPAIDCACQRCTEDEHQANRRTAFRIID